MTSAASADGLSLLSEASIDELMAVFNNFINTNDIKNWKILKLLGELLEKYKINDSASCVAIFKHSFKKFAKDYTNNDAKLKYAMQKLYVNCDNVLDSEPAKIIIRNHLAFLYTANAVDQTVTTSLPANPQPEVPKRAASTTSNKNSNKKLNHLMPADIKGLALEEKLDKLAKAYGEGKSLDLASPGLIPLRFAKDMADIIRSLNTPLRLVCTKEERVILVKVSEAKSLKQIEDIIKSISLVPKVDLQSYIFISLSKLLLLFQSGQLEDTSHKEGWYQGHVYADLFDAVFMFDPCYVTKRTECQATTIKYLKKAKKISQNVKDVKVDLILYNEQLGDLFSCEDKPGNATDADIDLDIKKAKELREKRLLYIQTLLPHPSNIKHIEVMSAQFHGLKVTVYGSKMTDEGTIVHYQKAKASIPTSPSNMSQAAHFMLTVMSLQRDIVLNLKKMEAICEAALFDSVNFLVPSSDGMAKNLLREDSPFSSQSSDDDSPWPPSTEDELAPSSSGEDDSSSLLPPPLGEKNIPSSATDDCRTENEENWMETEQSRRVVENIDKKMMQIIFNDEILTSDNWEDILGYNEANTQ